MSENSKLDELVANGMFERDVMDGTSMYRPTDRFFTDMPEEANEYSRVLGEIVHSLWNKGFLELEFEQDRINIIGIDVNADTQDLSEKERIVLRDARKMLDA